ncbi:MAG: restriction endonuclease [Thiobacillus sp.]|nr:restriction endonuclease [Thiobacillus sp.]
MARRNPILFDGLIAIASKLPWWVGIVLAMAAYFGLHSVAVSEVTAVAQPGMMDGFVGQSLFNTLATVGQVLLPFVFLVGAALSVYGRYQRRALHERVTGGPHGGALNQLSGQEFEALVGEAFRRKGYSVTETRGGADGRVDLALKKGGELFLVQCKHWRATRVGVNIVQKHAGLMAARSATGGFVLTSGVFTDEARAFAKGKNIELMDDKALDALTRGVSVPVKFFRDPLSVLTIGAPYCPECQSRMVKRRARDGANAGMKFWRCSRYPDCKGKRPA